MTGETEYDVREWAWAVEGSLHYLRQVADSGVGFFPTRSLSLSLFFPFVQSHLLILSPF